MTFKLLTIFPDMMSAVLGESILGRAIKSGAIRAEVIDIRPFSQCKHKNTDDAPYGGGAGMLMTAQPAADAIRCAMGENFCGKRIFLSPKGKRFDQKTAERLAREKELILFSGHYEGLDQRVIDRYIDEEISVGDYVLTGGELGALIVMDAVSRLQSGVLGSDESSVDESFSCGLLEYPQYTRPREFEGLRVPEVLLGGDQAEIDLWRRREALRLTLERRPEMLLSATLDGKDRAYLRSAKREKAVSLRVLSRDADRQSRAEAALYEISRGLVRFEGSENVLFLDGDIEIGQALKEGAKRVVLPRVPTENEEAAARDAGALIWGCTPCAFDPRFTELIGDDGIRLVLFSGMGRECFSYLASRILPVRKITEKAVCYPKSARAMFKDGISPRIEALFRDGTSLSFAPSGETRGFYRAALDFIETGAVPTAESAVETAKRILCEYAF